MLGSQYSSKIVLAITALVTATSLIITSPFNSQKVAASTSQETHESNKTTTGESDSPIVPTNLSVD